MKNRAAHDALKQEKQKKGTAICDNICLASNYTRKHLNVLFGCWVDCGFRQKTAAATLLASVHVSVYAHVTVFLYLYICKCAHPCIKMWHSDNISRLPDFNTPEPDIVTARMHARVYANVWLPYDSASRS